VKIHSAAILDPEARLAEDVEVGPGVTIEGPAIIGAGCVLQAHAVITGAVRLGKNNMVGYGAVLGAAAQDLGSRPETRSEVIIGDGNTIREYCTIHKGASEGSVTRVGNGNFLMVGAHLGHNVSLGNNVVIANNALLGGYVQVGDGAFLGGGSVYHQHTRVGQLAIAQGNSGFSKDIPPFTVAAEVNFVVGLNIVGMRRAGFSPEQRREVKDAFKLLYKSGLNIRQALERAREREWREHGRVFFDFVASAGKRGVCALKERATTKDGNGGADGD